MAQFHSVLTNYGVTAFAKAISTKQPLNILKMAVGDGNGRAVTPDSSRTALVREVYRANISSIKLDVRNNKQVIFELTIPEDVGGFYIREMGIFDHNEKLVAIANTPESYKPQLTEGSGKVQVLRMILLVSSNDSVSLMVDNSLIWAKRSELTPKDLDENSQSIIEENGHSHRLPIATPLKKGITQLFSGLDSDAESMAATPKAIKILKGLIDAITRNLGNYIPNSKKSNAVDSSSADTVATSYAVKTAYDKSVEARTTVDNLDSVAYKVNKSAGYAGNAAALMQENTVFSTADGNLLGLPSGAYPFGSGLSMSTNGGKALLYISHSGSQVWVKSGYGEDYSQPWKRIDGLNKEDALVEHHLDLTSLDQNRWYPVLMQMPSVRKLYRFALYHALYEESRPSWGLHEGGFGVRCEWEVMPSSWGIWHTSGLRLIKHFEYIHCNQSPLLNLGQLPQESKEYVYLRGGAKYRLYCEPDVRVEISRSDYHGASGEYRWHIPMLHAYDETLVPKPLRVQFDEIFAGLSNKVSKSGDEMRGDLSIRSGDWSGLNLYNLTGKYFRIETNPDHASHFGTFIYRNEVGSTEAAIYIPKKNGTMALIEDIAHTVRASVSRSTKSRTINGDSADDNGTAKQMEMVGEVVVYPDGKIEQFFHLKQFRDIWFAKEENAVGIANRDYWGRLIPIPLWTAMPNKVLHVDAQLARSSSSTLSPMYTTEAVEHQVSWAIRKQGTNKGQIWIDIGRIGGSHSEHIDLIIKVEGY